MKLKNINSSNIKTYLKITDLENMFSISYDELNNLKFNLNETLVLNVNDQYIEYYTPSYDMFWPLISYNRYGTTRLAWMLMKLNAVDAESIFDSVKAGTSVKTLKDEYINQIVQTL